MTDTYADVMERLKRLDEVLLLELLDLTTEDIIGRFLDVIEERYEEIERNV